MVGADDDIKAALTFQVGQRGAPQHQIVFRDREVDLDAFVRRRCRFGGGGQHAVLQRYRQIGGRRLRDVRRRRRRRYSTPARRFLSSSAPADG